MNQSAAENSLCPGCGTPRSENQSRCWLCGDAIPATATPVAAPAARRGLSFSLATLLTYITAIAVGLGLVWQRPSLGILYGIFIMLPLIFIMLPLIATRVAGVRRRARGKIDTPWQRAERFALNIIIFIGILVAIVIAILVACFVVCLSNLKIAP